MAWKKAITDYFSFTRKERLAVLVLLALIILVFLAPTFFSKKQGYSSSFSPDSSWAAALKKIDTRETKSLYESTDTSTHIAWQYDRSINSHPNRKKGELFYFDPNTITTEEWEKLGLRDKTIKTIQNYLSKGGHFYQPQDLSKVYGLFEDEYKRLAPYIRIVKKEAVSSSFSNNNNSPSPVDEKHRYAVIDINMADTSAFIALPGIGSKLALRITSFRDKLGGFYSISQVGETFGLSDSVFQTIRQYLKLETPVLRKININTASADELKAHPYIRYNLANPIIAYRKEHGPFSKVEDIKNIMAINNETYNRIAPYLSIEKQ
jgi:competence ComEA-like helix-hairpin-helix protein